MYRAQMQIAAGLAQSCHKDHEVISHKVTKKHKEKTFVILVFFVAKTPWPSGYRRF
jgi:hypothetical protein